ncbi:MULTISPECIES: hypothetical protein [Streptomyces]|uniref:Uncharacterized protein n=1 Tax=Streptomyces achmelvichensis TaxID=3134111 RepID=A0ACC6Q0L3_9ACTN|nr:hypothetical protein OG317_23895 [Streptomyces sp. NBC_01167]
MSIRHGAMTRRAVTAVLAAAALSLSTACGGGDSGSDDKKSSNSASTEPGKPQESGDGGGNTVPDKSKTLATISGSNGFEFTVHSAVRDEGGFLTVSGAVKNTSDKRQVPPSQWNGQETQVKRTGRSLAGMTLIDKAGKKRYYVLRDTDGFPLTTTGMSSLDSGKSVDFFAQFPAPPNETTTLDLQIPLMPTATIEIS